MVTKKFLNARHFDIVKAGNNVVLLTNDDEMLDDFMYIMFESEYITSFKHGKYNYRVYDYHESEDFIIVRDMSYKYSIFGVANEIKWEE